MKVASLTYILKNISIDIFHVKDLVTVQWLLQVSCEDFGKKVYLYKNFIYKL